ncbi:hypothetical protein BDD12DRAFT_151420 [Trichophaea hybrida]|nr:hypothetical protein BDD12DRAFT_151420 [Trichophaea hybrida]
MGDHREYKDATHIEIHNSILNDGQQITGSQTRDDRRLAGLQQQPKISRLWFWFLLLSRSKKRKDELSISECLRSLHFQDYQTRRLNVSERDPCTFEWIWKHPAFVKLQGKPASGKSTLMKYIRMDLDNRLSDSDTENASGRIVIDFFYSDRGGDAQRGHEWMLRSLLYQLLSTRHDMWNCYRSKFKEFKQLGHQHWQLESLKETFSIIKTSCHLPLAIYVLIDAMDESDQQKREDILKLLSGVCDSEGSLVLKILAASRPVRRLQVCSTNTSQSRWKKRQQQI